MKKIRVIFLIILVFLTNIKTAFGEVETTENKAFMNPEEVREYMKYMDEPEEVQRAREAIFNGENKIDYQIDVNEYRDYFVDKKYSPNQKFRDAEFFSNGMYNLWHSFGIYLWYYEGNLIYISKRYYIKKWKKTSYIDYFYNVNGKLKYIDCELSENNSAYVFDENKNYLYRWYKLKCYDTQNRLILKNRPYIPYK